MKHMISFLFFERVGTRVPLNLNVLPLRSFPSQIYRIPVLRHRITNDKFHPIERNLGTIMLSMVLSWPAPLHSSTCLPPLRSITVCLRAFEVWLCYGSLQSLVGSWLPLFDFLSHWKGNWIDDDNDFPSLTEVFNGFPSFPTVPFALNQWWCQWWWVSINIGAWEASPLLPWLLLCFSNGGTKEDDRKEDNKIHRC